jgi:hypothetical protein
VPAEPPPERLFDLLQELDQPRVGDPGGAEEKTPGAQARGVSRGQDKLARNARHAAKPPQGCRFPSKRGRRSIAATRHSAR